MPSNCRQICFGSLLRTSVDLNWNNEKGRFVGFFERHLSQVIPAPSISVSSWEQTICTEGIDSPDTSNLQADLAKYASLLRACGNSKALLQGKLIHEQIKSDELEQNTFLGNLLIQMYGNCGALENARETFAKMQERDKFSWNHMISAYARHGQGKKGLLLFDQMQLESITMDEHTSVSVLSACANEEVLTVGKQIHARITGIGFGDNVVVGNAIVNMYGKCGSAEDAHRVFDCIPIRNTVSWNAMLVASSQRKNSKFSVCLFHRMQQEGVMPNAVTFVSILSVCGNQATLEQGRRLHACLVGNGVELELIVGTSLVNFYSKCGNLAEAAESLHKMPECNNFSWNALIAAYSEYGQSNEALWSFNQMQEVGIMPNRVTYVVLLSACAKQETALIEAKRLHSLVTGCGPDSDVALSTALINMYGKCGSVEDALLIFHNMSERNIFSWNAMIAAHVQQSQSSAALNLFTQMFWDGLIPDKVTVISVLSACTSCEAQVEGSRLHVHICISGLDLDIAVSNALITMYGKCGSLDKAQSLFEEMLERDTVSWTGMIVGYGQCGNIERALQLFFQMKLEGVAPDQVAFASVVSACTSLGFLAQGKRIHACIVGCRYKPQVALGNVLISMYAKNGKFEDAKKSFEELNEHDNVTFVSILSASALHGALTEAKYVHGRMLDIGIELDNDIENALVNAYGRCGSLEDAERLFDGLHKKDVVSWNAVFAAYAQNGQYVDFTLLADQMQKDGVLPDEVTFVSFLSVCSRSGLIEDGCHQFVSMHGDHGIVPNVDHYNCIADILGRAGQLDKAEYLVNNMPFSPDCISWMTLLSACRNEHDIERGERAAKYVFELDTSITSPHVVLSNIIATTEKKHTISEWL